ncbi:MAG TPA: intradiol ring-cleavage dioxygenase, partial [Solirubrobacteraceae bacterium]
MTPRQTRREALLALGGLGAGAVALQAARAGWLFGTEPAIAATSCVLAPEVTEGPYWIANHLTRRDITEGRAGIPLSLHLTVVDATSCKPITGADVEIWHADAKGVYSGVQGNSGHFLRGHQRADANGRVVFHTIYPGWYRGRTPHIHLKVHVGGSVVHTGEVFFRDAVSGAVYRTSAYRSHGQADTTNANDNIYADAGGSRALLKLTKRSKGKGYVGAITLGVKR